MKIKKIKKLLIANRGEIALRIIRACRELKIKSVAVYSHADKDSFFVKEADESFCIGENDARESYLNIEKIIIAAKKTCANAIHPGYGFLSEEPLFAKRCLEEDIVFIGPSYEVMEKLGLKIESKKLADKLGIPRSPGDNTPIKSLEQAKKIAKSLGYPVMIKATGGGGGKGMRITNTENELEENLKNAQTEAKASFSNSDLFIEKYVHNPRHIEIQVIGDSFGNVVHFYERECSIQRKNQKVVEEAPSSFLTNSEREKLGDYAVKLAKEVDYVGAGTVEFMCDLNRKFYFCEMNTRIQVEHPVTELVTNFDLVKEQINVCCGKKLSVNQEDIKLCGHAFECRINSENPKNNFMPSIGKITKYSIPYGLGLRIDGILKEGFEITPYYDSMIVKLLSYGRYREEAIDRMKIFLEDIEIEPLHTNISLHKAIFVNKNFVKGNLHTGFLEENKIIENLPEQEQNETLSEDTLNASLCGVALLEYFKKYKGNKLNSWVLSSRD